MAHFLTNSLLIIASLAASVNSACFNNLVSSVPAPKVAQGYAVRLVATGLQRPRDIAFDSQGHLLVVESGKGVTAITMRDAGGNCVGVASQKTLIADSSLNHGIAVGLRGVGLFVSNSDSIFWYGYNASTAATTGVKRTLVSGMDGADHSTRTIVISKHVPGMFAVGRGSTSNIDPLAADIKSGHSQLKAFNFGACSESTCDFVQNGKLLGWGIRNEVGLAEHPTTGGIFGVENSVDQITRQGQDFHENNPAEELNFFGFMNSTSSPNTGSNFGYPKCVTAWAASEVPGNAAGAIKTGTQFSIDGSGVNDAYCRSQTAPILSFAAHMAPLDIKFNNAGTTAWVTFHGSWDRSTPAGYKLGTVAFANGRPVAPPTSMTALKDIVTNQDNTQCPAGKCFRPVGLAWDLKGRLYMSSDATGEIYVITNSNGGGLA